MKVAAAQIRPVWLDPERTVQRIIDTIAEAAALGVDLLAFPEAYLSGYPFWLCRTNAAAFDDARQRQAYAAFLDAAVEISSPLVARVAEAARDSGVSVYLGMNERGTSAGRGSIWCTMLAIHRETGVLGAHRKLMPTHDERLCWAIGDAHGLRVHDFGGLRGSALNCWENWMPQARYALYAGGAEVHFAAWPGNAEVANVAPEFIAREGRLWVVSVMGLLSMADIPATFPFHEQLVAEGVDTIFRGGSRIVSPAGEVVAEGPADFEGLIAADVDLALLAGARQSLDPTGHYARTDIFDVTIRGDRPEAVLWTGCSGDRGKTGA
ncbi:carbon-nitrogen hydrolase family protein [Mangrovicoccus algicola]|uniref:Carbon-nitrogen hydrolase family protein n=1 Tax=Mangrovicoccus algicola TaxID=2771008 RepID=A0A8J6YYS1_9RHOB|nr:carbon-nitrogen hydrolase family protein [Mangrovicoccus algicola]MBE3639109.1 carbon-nitrogen hydrolase family protein [Mangrovicoccus algicola]